MQEKFTRGDIAYLVLGCIAVVGVVAALAVAPGLGHVLKLIDPSPPKARAKTERTFRALLRSGHISRTAGGYKVTKRGMQALARKKFDLYKFPKMESWDKKLRMICFDIPEDRRYVRRLIQQKLTEIGCYPLQDSVFITPYNCKDLLLLIHAAFFAHAHVRGFVVTQIDEEEDILRHFRLSR